MVDMCGLAYGPVHQARLVGELERTPDHPDDGTHPVGAVPFGQPVFQGGEVLRVHGGDRLVFAEALDQHVHDGAVISPGAECQLAGVHGLLLRVQEDLGHVLDRQGGRVRPRRLARIQGIFQFQVLFQGAVEVIPRAEVVQLAADLLAPVAGRVGSERKIGKRLAWLGGLGRMFFGYGNGLLKPGWFVLDLSVTTG
jgi:hypothetical protein